MSGELTLVAAFGLGLAASGHCVAMCGGISGALMLSAERDAHGRPPLRLLLAMQGGRIASYMLAAFALAGAGAALVRFVDQDSVRFALRAASAFVFASAGLVLLGRARGIDIGVGRAIWPKLAPLARRWLPVRRTSQAFALGAIWGWMPCGFVYSVLLIAWLGMDAFRAAAIMALFGLGTLPALLASSWGARSLVGWLGRTPTRGAIGFALLGLAMLTLGGPWLAAHAGVHAAQWLPFDCVQP